MVVYTINIVLIVVLLFASYTDVRHRRILNWHTVPAIALGLALNGLNAGHTGLLSSLAACLFGLVLLIGPWLYGGVGAGDVKLLMAVGALKGWPFVLWTAWYGAIAAGLIAIVIMAKRRSILPTLGYLLTSVAGSIAVYLPPALGARLASIKVEKPQALSASLPAGLAIALGTAAALFVQYLQ